jgi:integrase
VEAGPTQRKEAILRLGNLRFFLEVSQGKYDEVPLEVALERRKKIHHCILHLKCSKTDQRRKGADVVLAARIVEILLDYLLWQPNIDDKHSALFVHQDGSSLRKQELVSLMRAHLTKFGFSPAKVKRFTGHSFRKGGAVSLDDEGDDVVKMMGRWKSSAHLRYHSQEHGKLKAAMLLGRGAK